jgi:hypothetical protein
MSVRRVVPDFQAEEAAAGREFYREPSGRVLNVLAHR